MVKNSFTPIIPQEENKGSQVFSFINKLKRIIRNSSVSKKFYYSVIVRTCFQKDNYDSLICFFLLCSYSDFYNSIPRFVIRREASCSYVIQRTQSTKSTNVRSKPAYGRLIRQSRAIYLMSSFTRISNLRWGT